jgi:hypothetical protein
LLRAQPALRAHPLPFAARSALPALFDRDGVVAVPHLGYRRTGSDAGNRLQMQADFSPMQALAGTGYFLA